MSDQAKNSLASKVGEFFEDLASLDVTTLSGKLTLSPGDSTSLKDLLQDFSSKIHFQKEGAGGDPASAVTVIAHTKRSPDGDLVQFFQQQLDDQEKAYLESHKAAVNSAVDQRQAFVQAVLDAIK